MAGMSGEYVRGRASRVVSFAHARHLRWQEAEQGDRDRRQKTARLIATTLALRLLWTRRPDGRTVAP
jgi:hypothetical protein